MSNKQKTKNRFFKNSLFIANFQHVAEFIKAKKKNKKNYRLYDSNTLLLLKQGSLWTI